MVMLTIGGCRLALDLPTWPAMVDQQFQTTNPTADLTILSRAAADRYPLGQRLFQADQVWALWQSEHVRSIVGHPPTHAEPLWMLQQTAADTWLLSHDSSISAAEVLFDYPALQLILIEWLSAHQGGLLHACGVIDGEQGLLLVGPPGMGKSTSARLWHSAGACILSDDRVIVRWQNEQLWAYGTPWYSSAGLIAAQTAPVQAICYLSHGAINQVTSLSSAQALRHWLPEQFLPLWNPIALDQALQLADYATSKLDQWYLAFVPDSEVISYVRQLLG
ncbi:hypothetical protein [Herpetosiphon gulosus]|uniref:HPr kinase/phosphorylase C-terminal domain-containing protein n=1 Tax=Herpetosiphon gulosus TaxID=1973496 RepID=A0ABP9WUP3_9CHLR